jgi:hypothetical protein
MVVFVDREIVKRVKPEVQQPSNHGEIFKSGLEYIHYYVNDEYLDDISSFTIQKPKVKSDYYRDLGLFSVSKIVLNKDENIFEKLTSVYSALNGAGLTLLLILKSTKKGIDLYLGVKSNDEYSTSAAKDILKKSFNGNFGGCELNNLSNDAAKELLSNISKIEGNTPNVAEVSIIPSLRNEQTDNQNFVQGMETFIDAMNAEDYTAIFIAEPLSKHEIISRKRALERLASTISHLEETTLSYTKSESEAVSEGVQNNFVNSINNNISQSKGGGSSKGKSATASTSSSDSSGYSTTNGRNYSNTSSQGFNSPFGNTSSSGTTYGNSYSSGDSRNHTTGLSNSSTDSYTTSEDWGRSVTSGKVRSTGGGGSLTTTKTESDSRTLQIRHTDKGVQNLLKQIDLQIERFRQCESFGAWNTSVYFVANDATDSITAANIFRSTVIGDRTESNSQVNLWNYNDNPMLIENTKNLLTSIGAGQHPLVVLPKSGDFMQQILDTSQTITGKELPIIFSLPRKSIKGVVVEESTEFARDVVLRGSSTKNSVTSKTTEDININIGNIITLNRITEAPVNIEISSFSQHCFICGSTGSGKTTTMCTLIDKFVSNHISFTVIEPVKGEYKDKLKHIKDLNILGTIPESYELLRINPFRFPPNIHVLEHIDRLISVFSACWALYSTQPFLLKSAIERSYSECGWDIVTNKHFQTGRYKYPNFSILKRKIKSVIEESGYKGETKKEFEGALLTRTSSLTNGINGLVLNSSIETDETELYDGKTIIDLSRVGSDETRSLLMGVLVNKLTEHRIHQNLNGEMPYDSPLRHITVLEEAHNLLKKTSTVQDAESSNVVGKAVEMIASSIAEMRTYGEGFLIVDQSPTSVDISAIKNTNTKIVHNLPFEDDYLLVGKSISLNENQIAEIPRLSVGQAVIKSNRWVGAIKTQINRQSKIDIIEPIVYNDEDYKSVLMAFIHETLRQADKKGDSGELFEYNDYFVKQLFKGMNIPSYKIKTLFSFYDQIKTLIEMNKFDGIARAEYIVNVIGCQGLSRIYHISPQNYQSWEVGIYRALDDYVTIENVDDKKMIASSIFKVAAYINEELDYVKYLEYIKKKNMKG